MIDWDVEKYKTEFECDEHWQLRKNFLLAHKDKFSEDRLVCLAQVFYNVEFMGCRYPEKTMKLVAELSEDIANEHREKQKGKLQRTFVKASDAAGAKVKGLKRSIGEGSSQFGNNCCERKQAKPSRKNPAFSSLQDSFYLASTETNNFNPKTPQKTLLCSAAPVIDLESDEVFRKKKRKTVIQSDKDRTNSAVIPVIDLGDDACDLAYNRNQLISIFRHVRNSDEPFRKLVLRAPTVIDNMYVSVLKSSASACMMTMRKSFDASQMTVSWFLDDQFIASARGSSKKEAQIKSAIAAYKRLQQTCFTLQEKSVKNAMAVDRTTTLGFKAIQSADLDVPLAEDNVGNKMMKLMGWTGGGLGKAQQGRQQPVALEDTEHKRAGLGSELRQVKRSDLGANSLNCLQDIQRLIRSYRSSDSNEVLVFSTDFSKDERKEIHRMAQRAGLKSKSRGGEKDRQLMISRKKTVWELVEEAVEAGGETSTHILIPPTEIVID